MLDKLAPVIQQLRDYLKPIGFARREARFSRRVSDVIQFIDVQRSVSSSADVTKFTIDVGVFSPKLAATAGDDPILGYISQCHWRSRVGYLMPVMKDRWWSTNCEADSQILGLEVVGLVEQFALPALDERSSLAKLGIRWLNGDGSSLTAYAHQKYCRILREQPELLRE